MKVNSGGRAWTVSSPHRFSLTTLPSCPCRLWPDSAALPPQCYCCGCSGSPAVSSTRAWWRPDCATRPTLPQWRRRGTMPRTQQMAQGRSMNMTATVTSRPASASATSLSPRPRPTGSRARRSRGSGSPPLPRRPSANGQPLSAARRSRAQSRFPAPRSRSRSRSRTCASPCSWLTPQRAARCRAPAPRAGCDAPGGASAPAASNPVCFLEAR